MRKSILFALMSMSISMFGQIPDSLNVTLPWELIYVESCAHYAGEDPISSLEEVYISDPDVIFLDDNSGNCVKAVKTWSILSWTSGEIYEFVQLVKVNEELVPETIEDHTILYSELPLTYTISDLLIDANPDHVYSFDLSDQSATSITFDENYSYGDVRLTIYDHTSRSVNTVDLHITNCEDDVSIYVPETAQIQFNGEQGITLTEEVLGIVAHYPCASYTIDMKVGPSNKVYAHMIGQLVNVKVTFSAEDGFGFFDDILLGVTGTPPPPIPMYIEDKSFQAGEQVTLDVWSDEVLNLIAWQFRLNFIDANILDITPGDSFENIPHNIFNDNKTINTIWFADDAQPIDMGSNDTWFTLTLEPTVDGTTLDLFTTVNDPWSSIAIEDSLDLLSFDADFSFYIEERNFLVSNNDLERVEVIIHNNPVSEQLNISGLDEFVGEGMLRIVNVEGEVFQNQKLGSQNSTINIDVSQLASGVYFLNLIRNDKVQNIKFFKL